MCKVRPWPPRSKRIGKNKNVDEGLSVGLRKRRMEKRARKREMWGG